MTSLTLLSIRNESSFRSFKCSRMWPSTPFDCGISACSEQIGTVIIYSSARYRRTELLNTQYYIVSISSVMNNESFQFSFSTTAGECLNGILFCET